MEACIPGVVGIGGPVEEEEVRVCEEQKTRATMLHRHYLLRPPFLTPTIHNTTPLATRSACRRVKSEVSMFGSPCSPATA